MIDLDYIQELSESGDVGATAYLLKYTKFDLKQLDMPAPLRDAIIKTVDDFLLSESAAKGLRRIEIAEYTVGLIMEGIPKSEEQGGAYYLAAQMYNVSVSTPRSNVKKYYPPKILSRFSV